MKTFNNHTKYFVFVLLATTLLACKNLRVDVRDANENVPTEFLSESSDTTNSANLKWNEFFKDPFLIALIDSALIHNQELNIVLQEINVARNEVGAKKGDYLPFVNTGVGAGIDKPSRYTMDGTSEEHLEIISGEENPEPIADFQLGLNVSWEIDVWKKLRNAKNAAYKRYLSSIEAKNFMVTNLVAEIANSYYELLALDKQLAIISRNLAIQENALDAVKLQKISARANALAVKKFEAEVYHTKSLVFEVKQRIVVAENEINFLVGRFPQQVDRSTTNFEDLIPNVVYSGIPSQLLENRPDIHQAEFNLVASKLDVKVARANFFPSFEIRSGIGLKSFNLKYFLKAPQSILYNLMGDLVAPLINRKAIKAVYFSANSKQLQAVFKYEQTILNAYTEVYNQISNINNLEANYDLKVKQVQALEESVVIAGKLFKSAEADYMEVLMTQRDALKTKLELVETKIKQLHATVNLYQALGGGWK